MKYNLYAIIKFKRRYIVQYNLVSFINQFCLCFFKFCCHPIIDNKNILFFLNLMYLIIITIYSYIRE